jgi:hypothetical protein
MATSHSESPLLDDVVEDAVDYKGNPVRRSSSGCWRSASFIIGKATLSHVLSYNRDWMVVSLISIFRGGGCGEARLLRNRLQPDIVSDGAFGAVHGHGGGECECMVRNGDVDSSVGSVCGGLLPWTLPHHYCCFSPLRFGLSHSLPPSLASYN